ncbi:GerAB/ArcD/ProY family transporter [Sporosarcina sp. FSL K6-1522]|uniref:GerAB/ArcD/ProY family transporter n=1 Tax=Sporosarcina sp. FSL K6-1522 TaxID=2921554 RepID=UPI00315A1103
MKPTKTKILNGYHVVFLVQNVMIGSTLITLPNLLSSVGYSQWWLPLLFALIANLLLVPMIWLMSRYPDDNLFEVHEKLFGKWVGKGINGLLMLYIVILIAAVCENYLDLIQVVALPDRTTTWPVVLFMLLLVYIVSGGIKSIARFCMMSFFLVTWMMYFLKWGMVDGDIRHLLPLLNFSFEELVTATKKGFISMAGFELILFYYSYIRQPQHVFKQASLGIWICAVLYLITVLASVMYFSIWQLENVLYPILYLFNAVKLSFLERVDVLAISLWMFFILTTAAAYLWVAKRGVDAIRGAENKQHLSIIAVVIFLFIIIPFPKEVQKMLYEHVFHVNYAFMVWPILLCALHAVKPNKEGVK